MGSYQLGRCLIPTWRKDTTKEKKKMFSREVLGIKGLKVTDIVGGTSRALFCLYIPLIVQMSKPWSRKLRSVFDHTAPYWWCGKSFSFSILENSIETDLPFPLRRYDTATYPVSVARPSHVSLDPGFWEILALWTGTSIAWLSFLATH